MVEVLCASQTELHGRWENAELSRGNNDGLSWCETIWRCVYRVSEIGTVLSSECTLPKYKELRLLLVGRILDNQLVVVSAQCAHIIFHVDPYLFVLSRELSACRLSASSSCL
jgi:hypothetical protein